MRFVQRQRGATSISSQKGITPRELTENTIDATSSMSILHAKICDSIQNDDTVNI